jgi:hypothetical protein
MWARRHPWGWSGLWALALFVAWVIIFRVTLTRDIGEDVVLAALPAGAFWLIFGSALSFVTGRRKG